MIAKEKIAYRLERLKKSGFEIVEGQPDITGWNVRSRSGKKVGEVDDLLFDPHNRKVRYLILDLDDNELGIAGDRKVLIPIGIAELYTKSGHYEHNTADPAFTSYDPANDGNVVYLPSVGAEQLDMLPLFEEGRLSPHIEMAIRKILESGADTTYEEDEFYRHEHFNDDRFYHRH
jgi:PRC-barrel domain